jgi:hypothetical protein
MWSGIEEVKNMLLQAEKWGEYSHFLRLRPDFRLKKTLASAFIEFDLFFGGQLLTVKEGKIGDQLYGGKLDRSRFILNTIEKLHELTDASDWNPFMPTTIAEDVIRKQLLPQRESLTIGYLDERFGGLTRAATTVDWAAIRPRKIYKLFRHNLLYIRQNLGNRLLSH